MWLAPIFKSLVDQCLVSIIKKGEFMKNFEYLTKDSFTQLSGEFIIKFTAPWCGPCKAFDPVLKQYISDETSLPLYQVNIDEEAVLARQFNIRSVPTIIHFKDGILQKQHIGLMGLSQLKNWLKT